jgi:hypothetical protein
MEDHMKKTIFAVYIILLILVLVAQGCGKGTLKEGEVLITGKIQKHERYAMEEAHLQFVPVQTTKQGIDFQVTLVRDIEGRIVQVECASDYPSIKIPPDHSFKYSLRAPKTGRYILALQQISPKGIANPVQVMRPLGKDGKVIVVEIPEGKKTPFRIDLGDVAIAYAESDHFVVPEYPDIIVVRP